MKTIIRLLKSMLFWAVISALAAVVAIIPIVKDWYKEEKGLEVYLSNGYLLTPDKDISIFYSIPSDLTARLTKIPFPIIIKNSSNKSVENFYIQLTAAKRMATTGVGIRRLVPTLDYYPEVDVNNETKKLFSNVVFSDKDSLNIIGNYIDGNRTLFYGNKEYNNLLLLNVAYDTMCSPSEPFDSFQLSLLIGADGIEPHEFTFNIYAYYNDSPNFIKYLKSIYNDYDDNYYIKPEFGKEDKTGDNLRHVICNPQCYVTKF